MFRQTRACISHQYLLSFAEEFFRYGYVTVEHVCHILSRDIMDDIT